MRYLVFLLGSVLVALFGAILWFGVDRMNGRIPQSSGAIAQNNSPQALADSLIYATREFCVPYVVDGASVASLTQRPGVSEQRYNIHGQDVTRYRLQEKAGSPEVTLDEQDYCRVDVEVAQSTDRQAIVAAFARNLQLNRHDTSQPHSVELPGILEGDAPEGWHGLNVMCVHGKSDALISISSLPGYPIHVYVRSDPGIVAAESCVAAREPR